MKRSHSRTPPAACPPFECCVALPSASVESAPAASRKQHHRSGLTLLEVLVSTAIFLGALTAILQIMRVGHDSRLSAKLDAEAALRCEALMAELVSGIRPLTTASNEQFEGEENWVFDVETEDGGGEGLLQITVRVKHTIGEQTPNSTFQLTRLMRDPQLFLDAAMAESETEE